MRTNIWGSMQEVMNTMGALDKPYEQWSSAQRMAFLCGWENETLGTVHDAKTSQHPAYSRGQRDAKAMKADKQRWS